MTFENIEVEGKHSIMIRDAKNVTLTNAEVRREEAPIFDIMESWDNVAKDRLTDHYSLCRIRTQLVSRLGGVNIAVHCSRLRFLPSWVFRQTSCKFFFTLILVGPGILIV